MSKISVAGIKIDFTYVYPDLFDSLLEQYLIEDDLVDHTIQVTVSDGFDVPKGLKLQANYKNRFVYESKNHIHIVAYNEEGVCKQYIQHSKDYKHIIINLHSSDSKSRLIELEYVLSGLLFVELALLHNRLAIHASAIEINHQGILFSASSGTGKSTHATHWMNVHDGTVINDDKPLVYLENNHFVVSGTPWCGKDLLQNNITIPLQAIVFLERGNNIIQDLSTKDKILKLYKNSIRPRNEHLIHNTSLTIEQLALQIPIIQYQATIDESSVEVLYNYLFGGNHEN